MKTKLSSDEKISQGLTRVEILESSASVAPDAAIQNYQATVKGKVSSIVYNEKDLENMAIEKFKSQVSSNQEVVSVDDKAIKYELSDISGTDGKAEVKISVPANPLALPPSELIVATTSGLISRDNT